MFSVLFHSMFSTCMHLFLFLHEYSMVLSILVPIFLTTVFLLLHPLIILCLRFLTLFHIRFFCHISLFVFPVILQYFFLFASNAFLIPSNLLFLISVITSSSLSSSSSSISLLFSVFNFLFLSSSFLFIFFRCYL